MSPLDPAIPLHALERYALPPRITATLINVSENATYRIDADDGQRWALRVHREGYHSRAAIASELAWLMHLRATEAVITPRPMAGKNGALIQEISHHTLAAPRHVVLFHWEEGQEPLITDNLTASFAMLGEVTARMHVATRTWQRPATFERFTWNFETSLGEAAPHWGRWRDGIGVDHTIAPLFARTVAVMRRRLLAYGQGPQRFGLTHCDLRLANLLVDGDQVKVIDFDDCGFSWLMYDAATPVSFHEHEPQVPALIAAWKEGYRKVAPIAHEDEAEIPTFIMLRRLLLIAWIGTRRETDLARAMGRAYTEGAAALCERYLSAFS